MKYKNWKKNRSILLAHDLITYNLSDLYYNQNSVTSATDYRKVNTKLLNKSLILKANGESNKTKMFNMFNFLDSIEIISNVDFKPFRGVSFNSSEGQSTKLNSKLKLLITFFLIKKITGQFPSFIKAKKSVANFNIRAGMDIGIKLTLRSKALEQFYKNYNLIMSPIKGVNHRIKENKEIDFSIKSFSYMQPLNGYFILKDTWSIYKNKMATVKTGGEEIKELLNISNKIKIEQEQIGAHIRFNLNHNFLTSLSHDKKSGGEIKKYILNYFIIPS